MRLLNNILFKKQASNDIDNNNIEKNIEKNIEHKDVLWELIINFNEHNPSLIDLRFFNLSYRELAKPFFWFLLRATPKYLIKTTKGHTIILRDTIAMMKLTKID